MESTRAAFAASWDVNNHQVKHASPKTPLDPRLIEIDKETRNKTLDELTKFMDLDELFKKDNEASKDFFGKDPKGFLDNAPNPKDKIVKEAKAQIKAKEEVDAAKQALRKKILDLFIIFKVDNESVIRAKVTPSESSKKAQT